MTISHKKIIKPKKTTLKSKHGLAVLEGHIEYHTYLYILRQLYRMVFRAFALNETHYQLCKRIRRFEKQSDLPKVLSSVPLDQLLTQLENAQFIYPIRHNEINFLHCINKYSEKNI